MGVELVDAIGQERVDLLAARLIMKLDCPASHGARHFT
jgi:hypothetical protein